MAKISVVVPVYKVEPYLRQCIDSIIEQTFSDFELILVDDGSPDDCGEICDEYATRDGRIKVIHQENRGLSEARNAGIKAAEGEYITFIDSDDFVDIHYLEYLYKGIVDHSADISICNFHPYKENDLLKSEEVRGSETITGREACINWFERPGGVQYEVAWCKMYKLSMFETIRYPAGRIHEDTFTTYKLLYPAAKICVLKYYGYYYRQTENSIMRRTMTSKRYDAVEAYASQKEYYDLKNDQCLSELAEKMRMTQIAILRVQAQHDDVLDVIPDDYKMSEYEAMKILYKNLPQQNYEWYLSLNHPNLVAHHERLMKIKSIFKNIFKK